MDFVYFIVLVGVLVFVHELGHFVWAKFFGVRVLCFSLGFGPRLVGLRIGETEYRIGALPLGGYVKMLGESPNDEIRPEDEPRAFHFQPLWKRLLIVVAGPAMNLVFPIALFFVVYLGDTELAPSTVGVVFPDRPADGRLLPGDTIESIDGEPIHTFYDVSEIISQSAGKPLRIEVLRDGKKVTETVTPSLDRDVRELDRVEEVGRVGIKPHHPLAVVGVTSPSTPAGAGGLRTFDVVVSVAGQPVDRWLDLERALSKNEGASVPLTVLRPKRVPDALDGLIEMETYEPRVLTVTPEPGDGSGTLRTGIEPAELYVSYVTAGSPEHRMGLLPGDRIVTLDGRPVRRWQQLLEDLRAGGGGEHELTWRRGHELISGTFAPRHERGTDEHGQRYDRYVVSMRNWMPMRVDEGVDNPIPFRYAFDRSLESTAEMIELTVYSVVRLLEGQLSVKTIGGPIAMFDVAGTAARRGTVDYLRLMAFISINLGLINLLPIPLLDGGHVLFFLIEGVTRRRPSPRTRQYASLAGLVVLIVLMTLAVTNDIERQWPKIVDWVAGE